MQYHEEMWGEGKKKVDPQASLAATLRAYGASSAGQGKKLATGAPLSAPAEPEAGALSQREAAPEQRVPAAAQQAPASAAALPPARIQTSPCGHDGCNRPRLGACSRFLCALHCRSGREGKLWECDAHQKKDDQKNERAAAVAGACSLSQQH